MYRHIIIRLNSNSRGTSIYYPFGPTNVCLMCVYLFILYIGIIHVMPSFYSLQRMRCPVKILIGPYQNNVLDEIYIIHIPPLPFRYGFVQVVIIYETSFFELFMNLLTFIYYVYVVIRTDYRRYKLLSIFDGFLAVVV